jgi:hypothetical protein
MKKLITVSVIALCVAVQVFSQEITMSGEFKTGLFWFTSETEGRDAISGAFIHNSEDTNLAATSEYSNFKQNPGRFRLNFQVDTGNIGTKFRFETTRWPGALQARAGYFPMAYWGYAFAYGYFWDNQIKISGGKMGDSPWGSGGPEMWRELDTAIGIRFEFIPGFIPFIRQGQLNFGFVFNDMNTSSEGMSQAGRPASTLLDILQESVLGFSYTHDYFLVRLAYRLDSLADDDIGDQLLYRVEERIIQKFLPGFQIFANGYFFGLNGRTFSDGEVKSIENKENVTATNWVYVQYAPDNFTAQLRFGFDVAPSADMYYLRASFFYNFFNNLVNAGTAFEWAQDSGPNRRGHEYLRWFLEPQVRLNLAPGTYVAFVYRYQDDYHVWNAMNTETIKSITHWINLRAVFSF